ncbi:hypothetical protein K461DRAFT_292696 [Myriangium duriaei CBS 260.36]|uniref:Phosphatidate phosphatase APP1 catalytic domain-containing protein n=1 Tax=Myriangium duriaei CBS 260.36 TaxID=1168546 RepID=A0A9P4J3S7_9PEZI|nr:hypothetical protein K461DRAFT_292696 [Myriangium duriaei CBS 260.36]
MAYRGQADRGYSYENIAAREPGARRKKIAGYLRAANELRQTYTQSWNKGAEHEEHDGDLLDATNVARVTSGEEEMILFPSYAKPHIRQTPAGSSEAPGTGRDYGERAGTGDADFWRRQWEQYEDDRAVVDVDVRGWVFTPHKGPMSRKHRLMVALARQLVGIPAPATKTSPTPSLASSRQSSPTRRQASVQEEQLASQQAEAIIKKGEAEAEIAGSGGFSERPRQASGGGSVYDDFIPAPGASQRRQNTLQTSPGTNPSQASGQQTAQAPLTAAELAVANTNLMTRLKPFMANPLIGSTVNVFFYNETMSRQKTVTTDSYGHFSFRAPLEFLPTHVRVLVSEGLSLQEEVKIVASKGVSLISDVDDTIRHSAITKGAREIFRNAFVRDMGELTITGVKEWYNKMADMGVQVHYVSNSPWQLFPALTSFFSIAGLPKGSFHLKQYSGMLQGIFEPVAERKKATLERILRDFPDRKFVLIGDSGEADLEVYTDVVLEHPGRVLGVFIRDVTSPPSKGFFDPSAGPLSGSSTPKGRHSRNQSVDSLARAKRFSRPSDIHDDEAELQAAIAASLKDMELETAQRRRSVFSEFPGATHGSAGPEEARPPLPPRRSQVNGISHGQQNGAELGDLIDFGDDEVIPTSSQSSTSFRQNPSVPDKPVGLGSTNTASTPIRPQPPTKPARLRSPSNAPDKELKIDTTSRIPPPLPRKPSTSVRPASPSPLYQVQDSSPVISKPPALPQRQTYRGLAKQKLNSAYNALPSASTLLNGHQTSPYSPDQSSNHTTSPRSLSMTSNSSLSPADARSIHGAGRVAGSGPAPLASQPAHRRPQLATAGAAAASTATRLGSYWNGQESVEENYGQPVNKREELWKRRWLRAKEVMDRDGVMLRTWRVGSDVMDECIEAVHAELERMHNSKAGEAPSRWRPGRDA